MIQMINIFFLKETRTANRTCDILTSYIQKLRIRINYCFDIAIVLHACITKSYRKNNNLILIFF